MFLLRLLFMLFLLSTLSAAQTAETFNLSGYLQGIAAPSRVLFKKYDIIRNVQTLLDTIYTDSSGRFSVNYDYDPGIYVAHFPGIGERIIPFEKRQKVFISVDARFNKKNPEMDAIGTYPLELVQEFERQRQRLQQSLLSPLHAKLTRVCNNNDVTADSLAILMQQAGQVHNRYRQELSAFVMRFMPNTSTFFYGALFLDPYGQADFLKQQAAWFMEQRPDLPLSEPFHKHVQQLTSAFSDSLAAVSLLPHPSATQAAMARPASGYTLLSFHNAASVLYCADSLFLAHLSPKLWPGALHIIIMLNGKENPPAVNTVNASSGDTIRIMTTGETHPMHALHADQLPVNLLIAPDGRVIARNLFGSALMEKLTALELMQR